MISVCANCVLTLDVRANSGRRGPDIAWMAHCRDCADLVGRRMRLIERRPNDAAIDFWRCNSCGTVRSCRPRWRTRCPICLDDRTVLDDDTSRALKAQLRVRGVRAEVAEGFGIPAPDVTDFGLLTAQSIYYLVEHEAQYARPGWTIRASDVRGMPWGYRDPSVSHGTWAVHDACGTVQKVTLSRTECGTCPPEEGSRTHRAKAGQPQFLYLVRWLDLLKFGHGDAYRVQSHLRAGCDAMQVLRATHAKVVHAELEIKRALHAQLIDPGQWDMPVSFGAGTEVVTDQTRLDLTSYLNGREVQDVTHQFR